MNDKAMLYQSNIDKLVKNTGCHCEAGLSPKQSQPYKTRLLRFVRNDNVYWYLMLAGFLIGLFSLFVLQLELKWVVTYFSLVGLFFLAFFSGNVRHFCLGLFIFAIPLNIQKVFWAFPDYKVLINGTFISPALRENLAIFFSDLPLLVLFMLWFLDRVFKSGEELKFPKTSFPLLLFLGWSVLSFIKSESLILSFLSFISFIKYFLIFLYLANNIKTAKEFKIVTGALFLGFVLQGLITIAQWQAGSCITVLGKPILSDADSYLLYRSGSDFFRGTGTVGISNVQAMYFELVLPLAFGLIMLGKTLFGKAAYSLGFLIGTFGLIVCFSKAGWGSLLLMLILIFMLLYYGRFISVQAATAAVLTLFVVGIIAGGYVISNERFIDKDSLQVRPNTYRIAYRIITENPLLGVGLNNSTAVQWQNEYDPKNESLRTADGTVYPIHNLSLILISEVGLIGFGFLSWFVLAYVKKGLAVIRKADKFSAITTIGMLAGLGGYFIHTLVDIGSSEVHLSLIFIYAGIICALESTDVARGFIPRF